MRIPPDTLLALFPPDEPLVTPDDFWAAESSFNTSWIQLAATLTLDDPLGARHALLSQFRAAIAAILDKRYREFDALLLDHPQRSLLRSTRAYYLSRERLAPTLLNAISALRALAGEEDVHHLGEACKAALVRTISTAWIIYRSFAVSEIRGAVEATEHSPASPTTVTSTQPSSPSISTVSTVSPPPSTVSRATSTDVSPGFLRSRGSSPGNESTASLVDALERLASGSSGRFRSATPTQNHRLPSPTTPTTPTGKRNSTVSPTTPKPRMRRATTPTRGSKTSPKTPRGPRAQSAS